MGRGGEECSVDLTDSTTEVGDDLVHQTEETWTFGREVEGMWLSEELSLVGMDVRGVRIQKIPFLCCSSLPVGHAGALWILGLSTCLLRRRVP